MMLMLFHIHGMKPAEWIISLLWNFRTRKSLLNGQILLACYLKEVNGYVWRKKLVYKILILHFAKYTNITFWIWKGLLASSPTFWIWTLLLNVSPSKYVDTLLLFLNRMNGLVSRNCSIMMFQKTLNLRKFGLWETMLYQ